MMKNILTFDIEEWFHILDSTAVPPLEAWDSLEPRLELGLSKILALLDKSGVKATFFWLGWVAERYPHLVRKCHALGHEIASHGYAHLLVYQVGREKFRQDIRRGKEILEAILGEPIQGFRAPGFSITDKTPWAYDEIRQAGYTYDSSIFPTSRGHGGIPSAPLAPFAQETKYGALIEFPMSMVNIFNRRISMFGGGYFRLFPYKMIHWGISRLNRNGLPAIIYLHPRELDPDHPRLRLSLLRYFKCYVNLKTTIPKLSEVSRDFNFFTMGEAAIFIRNET